MKIGKRRSVPPQRGLNRFYYPLAEVPSDLAGARMQSVEPCSVGGDLLKSDCDPNGSYTGVPESGGKPVQDADDL